MTPIRLGLFRISKVKASYPRVDVLQELQGNLQGSASRRSSLSDPLQAMQPPEDRCFHATKVGQRR